MKDDRRERPFEDRVLRGWLGALVLCVLLAAVGLPGSSGGVADHTRVELRDERGHGPRPIAMVLAALPARSIDAVTACEHPRPLPRVRSIADGGLPPPRAPTA